MPDLHLLLAEVSLALSLLGTAWSVVLVATGRGPGRLYLVNLIWLGIVIALTGALGALGLATGRGVHDPLHLVYGALAITSLPGAALVAAGRPARQQAIVGLIASVVLLIIILRLFQTGA